MASPLWNPSIVNPEPAASPSARTAFVPPRMMVSPAEMVPVTLSVLPASISTVPMPVKLATVMLLGSSRIVPLFTTAAEPARVALSSVKVPALVRVVPASRVLFAPVSVHAAPLSIVI